MKLFYAPNTISAATVIAMEEVGLSCDLQKVDFTAAEQTKPAYHAVNPKGRVPALVTDQGTLTETIAILEYVAPALIPKDPWRAAKMRELMTYLATTMHVNHAHGMRGHRWADSAESHSDMLSKVPQTMAESAQYVDGMIEGPFVLGDQISLADPYLYTVCTWLAGDGVDISQTPTLAMFFDAMESRPSVIAVREKGILT